MEHENICKTCGILYHTLMMQPYTGYCEKHRLEHIEDLLNLIWGKEYGKNTRKFT